MTEGVAVYAPNMVGPGALDQVADQVVKTPEVVNYPGQKIDRISGTMLNVENRQD